MSRNKAIALLDRLRLLEVARRWRVQYGPGRIAHRMRFPTFGPEIERAAIASGDYVRYSALALGVRTIQREGVEGAFAEAGVYRGATSRFLQNCAPERRLYLFDTFEGFHEADLEAGNEADPRFRDTSEALVRSSFPPNADIVIRKGYFPDSARGLERERFALAVLDLDVFAPTLTGIEFFYPRLTPGAFVFVHDYNSPESNSACSRAVGQALRDKPERAIELPDVWGSVVFRKL